VRNNLYNFTDNQGSFISASAHKFKSLYFPLGNELLMSALSADLHGDIKTGQNSFLMPPVSRIDLSASKFSRNVWIYINKAKIWSATGVSKDLKQIKQDIFTLKAGLLWQKIERVNKTIGLKAEILSFVPASKRAAEVMQVKFTNISSKEVKFTPYAAIPMYCRSADNLRDHRQVTSLLARITLDEFGVVLKPTLVFDEAGHRRNELNYFVLGWDQKRNPPRHIYPTQEMFCGDSGDLEAPQAVLENILPRNENIQGKEGLGGLRFAPVKLSAGASASFTVLAGIQEGKLNLKSLINEFDTCEKVEKALVQVKSNWLKNSQSVNLDTADKNFDNWFRWVNIQPHLRRIFGCSFLPDFDYGRGGRGWRDLWQDCLGLILSGPAAIRASLVNNFGGVKIDGSNATIIGKKSGEFIADRNNLSRVWMDHGVWPLLTLNLYINETGDLDILFEKAAYFRNHEINRARNIDPAWSLAYGNKLKTKSGKIYQGTILEHLLAQNLAQFFNVGSHNHIRLEGADWNDGLDMAKDNGESVAFSAMYAHNLELLAELLLKTGKEDIFVAREIKILLSGINYESIAQKHKILDKYFARVAPVLSGKLIALNARELAADLRVKSGWIKKHIRKTEWLKAGFFNGYYDNKKQRLDGKHGKLIRLTLASQVFPVMAALADSRQIKKILANTQKYLFDQNAGGLRLNTDFGKEQLDLGRAFSFAYGEKENGAIFSHMVVMFAYALYKQGYAQSGWEVLSSLYKMAVNTDKSKIYPCLPEYFNLDGRGMYSYLTGSASWFVLTLLIEVFGVKGQGGDLVIEPKLSAEQFKFSAKIGIQRSFAGREIRVNFFNPQRKAFGKYKIIRFRINSQDLPIAPGARVVVSREVILSLSPHKPNILEAYLG